MTIISLGITLFQTEEICYTMEAYLFRPFQDFAEHVHDPETPRAFSK